MPRHVCVTAAVNYLDMLQYALPSWRSVFADDEIYVLTSTEDTGTQQYCVREGVNYLATDAFFRNGATFNRGRARNELLKVLALEPEDWLLFVDGDIVFPAGFQIPWASLNLDPTCIYGVARTMCREPETWWRYLKTGDDSGFQPKNDRKKFPMIVGYFQLFQYGAFQDVWKGVHPEKAVMEPTDLWFSDKWGRNKQRYLQGQVIHLGPDGMNWHGRKSARFLQKDE